jgi:hypothetical protein
MFPLALVYFAIDNHSSIQSAPRSVLLINGTAERATAFRLCTEAVVVSARDDSYRRL